MMHIIKIAIFAILFSVHNGYCEVDSTDVQPVKAFVENFYSEVLQSAESESISTDKKIEVLSKILSDAFSNGMISSFVLGRKWLHLSQEQRNDFVEAYQSYSVVRYIQFLDKLYNTEIKIKRITSHTVRSGVIYQVYSTVIYKAKAKNETETVYKVIKQNDSDKFEIYDISFDGFSPIMLDQSSFSSDTRHIDDIIADLKQNTYNTLAKINP